MKADFFAFDGLESVWFREGCGFFIEVVFEDVFFDKVFAVWLVLVDVFFCFVCFDILYANVSSWYFLF